MYLASSPFYETLRERILMNAIGVSGLYGIIGTILMGHPGSAIPINAILGAVASVIVTVLLHMILKRRRVAI
jgi:hypothetical protein